MIRFFAVLSCVAVLTAPLAPAIYAYNALT